MIIRKGQGGKMYKILLGSFIAMLASAPVFGAPSLTCDASGIGATTPNARMKASWTQNTYNLEWYGDDNSSTPLTVQNSAQSCDYGNALVLPSTNPSKVGYTFIGWETEEILSQTCSAIQNSDISYTYYNEDDGFVCCLNGMCYRDYCESYQAEIADLSSKQWKVQFGYGEIKGESWCNGTDGNYAEAGNPVAGNEQFHCWCRVTDYKSSNSATCSISAPSRWVYVNDHCSGDTCNAWCAQKTQNDALVRSALYGINTCSGYNLDANINENNFKCLDITAQGECKNLAATNADSFGISYGQYVVPFSYGLIFGEASCKPYNNNGGGAGYGQYCWCKIIGYTPDGGNQCITSSRGTFYADYGDYSSCYEHCAYDCAKETGTNSTGWRSNFFQDAGLSQ